MTDKEIMVRIRERCQDCENGYIHNPHCIQCHERIAEDSPFWKSSDDVLPCGHPIRKLIEEYACHLCDGTTWVEAWVSPDYLVDAILTT